MRCPIGLLPGETVGIHLHFSDRREFLLQDRLHIVRMGVDLRDQDTNRGAWTKEAKLKF